jgi:hypothetical protein
LKKTNGSTPTSGQDVLFGALLEDELIRIAEEAGFRTVL